MTRCVASETRNCHSSLRGCLCTNGNWNLQNSFGFESFLGKFILDSVVDASAPCKNTADLSQTWTHVWGILKGMFVACRFLSTRVLGSENVSLAEKCSQLCFEIMFFHLLRLVCVERSGADHVEGGISWKSGIFRKAQSGFRISRQLVVLMDEATSPGQGWIGIH